MIRQIATGGDGTMAAFLSANSSSAIVPKNPLTFGNRLILLAFSGRLRALSFVLVCQNPRFLLGSALGKAANPVVPLGTGT